MSKSFDDVAMSLASEGTVGRRSMIRGALAAVGLGAGAVLTGAKPAGAAPGGKPVSCPPGLTACNGLCRDLTSSHANCGGCGNACASNAVCSNGTCVTVECGTCEPTCPSGLTWCGACVNTATDTTNCGACGNPCASGLVCSNGECVQCAGDAQCPPDDDCGSYVCSNGACVRQNAPNGTSCGGASGGTCSDGLCTNTCSGANLLTDPQNCGACGNVCQGVNSTPICVNGTCGHGTCNAGFADCDPNQPGCETDITTDFNCGACGRVCDAGTTCVNGTCTSTCIPATCADLGKECGTHSDGCGGTINCGICRTGTTCSGDGVCVPDVEP